MPREDCYHSTALSDDPHNSEESAQSSIAEAIWEIRCSKPDVRARLSDGYKWGLDFIGWTLVIVGTVSMAVWYQGLGAAWWKWAGVAAGTAIVLGTPMYLWLGIIKNRLVEGVHRLYDTRYVEVFDALQKTSLPLVLLEDEVWQELFRHRGVTDFVIAPLAPPKNLAERIAFSAAFFVPISEYMSNLEITDVYSILAGCSLLNSRSIQGRYSEGDVITYYARYNALCDFFSRFEAEVAPQMTWQEYQASIHPGSLSKATPCPPHRRPLPPAGFDQFLHHERPLSEALKDLPVEQDD